MNRRYFLGIGSATVALASGQLVEALASAPRVPEVKFVDTPVLRIAYEEMGPSGAFPVMLLHGFSDDVRAWDDVAPHLADGGYRVLVPYLRGFGPTRFRQPSMPRMAEQAAIGQDVMDFADALGMKRFAVAGYDWGGRAACIVAALYPSRISAALLIQGYSIQNTVHPQATREPDRMRAWWYQWYFNTEMGRSGLASNRREICRFLWKNWSPNWEFSEQTFQRTATSFDNPDSVPVVIHSYRHRNGNAPGEPRFAETELALAKRPPIHVPVVALYGAVDGVQLEAPPLAADKAIFSDLRGRQVIAGVGHLVPRERPDIVSAELLGILRDTAGRA